MKKLYLILFLLISCVGMAWAHDDDSSKRDKMFREVQQFKMKYLAQEMELTEAQKEKFFPLYEEMSASRQKCFERAVTLDRKLKHSKDASEEEYQNVTNAFNTANTQWAEEERQFNQRFSEFLSSKQMYKMKEAEQNFKAKLEEMRHKKKKEHKKGDAKK